MSTRLETVHGHRLSDKTGYERKGTPRRPARQIANSRTVNPVNELFSASRRRPFNSSLSEYQVRPH